MRRALILLSLLACAAPLGAAEGSWIHVEVQDRERRATTVRVNLPMSALLRALPLIPDPRESRCRFVVGDARITSAEMRRLWQQLEAAPEGTVVRQASRDLAIAAERSSGMVRIRFYEHDDGESVAVTMREPVVRALGSTWTRHGLAEALRTLAEQGGGEILMVDEDDALVRIWIDAGPGPGGE